MNHLYHVIKDPVHGTLQFSSTEDAWVKPFINSENFQRLRHIKQMGMGDLIFPGAVHTRLNHCLGCSYVAGQIAQKIGLTAEERQLVMIAGLMHDIGHGPFSHTFEGIFYEKMIRHEEWTPLFLKEYSQESFFDEYNRVNPRYHLNEEKFRDIANMIMHKPVAKQVMADVVSSQLDADRLDYLLRDSHFSGVRYGEFDFRWLLHCLTIVSVDDSERLGVTHKGIGAVEHYLMARRLMVQNIYHSRKKLAIEFLFVQMLADLAENLADYPAYENIKNTRFGRFLLAVSEFNQAASQAKEPKRLVKKFVEANYAAYRQLCDYDVFVMIRKLINLDENTPACQLAKRVHGRIIPKIVRLENPKVMAASNLLHEFKKDHPHYQDWQLAINKVPHQSYSGNDDPIWVVDERHQVKSIDRYSLMLNALSDQFEHTAFLCVDREIAADKAVQRLVERIYLL